MSANVRFDTTILDGILKKAPERADKAVRETAFNVESKAKQATPLATGALRNSGYTKTSKSNAFNQSKQKALAHNKGVMFTDEPEEKMGLGKAIVGFSVEYALFNEIGTSRMAARPFLVPAVESERDAFEKRMKEVTKP